MKFFSFIFIFFAIVLTISIKILIANQETKIKSLNKIIIEFETSIENKKTDISYSTRPQNLKDLNLKEFQFQPILQSDIIKIE